MVFDYHNIWSYGVMAILLLGSLAFVRNLAHFSYALVFANTMLLISVIIISYYSMLHIYHHGINKEIVLINT